MVLIIHYKYVPFPWSSYICKLMFFPAIAWYQVTSSRKWLWGWSSRNVLRTVWQLQSGRRGVWDYTSQQGPAEASRSHPVTQGELTTLTLSLQTDLGWTWQSLTILWAEEKIWSGKRGTLGAEQRTKWSLPTASWEHVLESTAASKGGELALHCQGWTSNRVDCWLPFVCSL